MGLKANIVNATFDTIIPGLAAGKYDMGASSFTDTKAREKVVNFVDYFQAGTSFFTKASGGAAVTNLASLCGKTVAVESGTTEETDAKAQSVKCKATGKPGVNVLVLPDPDRSQPGAFQRPRADLDGRLAGRGLSGQAVTRELQARRRRPTATAPYGLAIPKNSTLDKAVLAGVKQLMSNGTYNKIMTKWGIQSGAIPASEVKINGATS